MKLVDPGARKQIFELVDKFEINLGGMVVATEAGSGPFLYSSLIALVAGASDVIVVAPDSLYGSHKKLLTDLISRAESWGLPTERLKIISSRAEVPSGIDIFLNLGFLRPLDCFMLDKASDRAVVSYMCESWEVRPGDLDFKYCVLRDIPIAGVNENFGGAGVFDSCGQLALKMLFEAGIEVRNCRIGILSDDPFGEVIKSALVANGALVEVFIPGLPIQQEAISNLDALILASYSGEIDVLTYSGINPAMIWNSNPDLCLLQFAGAIRIEDYQRVGLKCIPGVNLDPFRMAKTLAYLGKRPVIDLHALGIKVGELLFRKKNFFVGYGRFVKLVQELDPSSFITNN